MAAIAASVAHVIGRFGAGTRGRSVRRRRRRIFVLFLGRGRAAEKQHGGSQECHETQAAQRQMAEHATLRKFLIKKHPPLLNSGWGKRTPLL